MEKWEIVMSVIGVYGPLILWLALNNIQHTKKIAVMEQNSLKTDKHLEAIENKVDTISNRLDLFLKNELDTLKQLLNKV